MSDNKKIVGFKKFSDIKSDSSKVEEVDMSLTPDKELPMNPNISSTVKKVEKRFSPKNIEPIEENDDTTVLPKNEEVKTFGKVAKLPRGVLASKGFNFLENVKISKKSIWYIMVETMNDELQMVKYNYKEGVDLSKFVNELKTYYLTKHKDNKAICEAVSKIGVDGNDKYSKITNISKVKIDNKLLITKITEDLIKLLSK